MNEIKRVSLIVLLLSTALVQSGYPQYCPDGFPNSQEGLVQKKSYEKNITKRFITIAALTAATAFTVSMAFKPFIPQLLASNKIASGAGTELAKKLTTTAGCAQLTAGLAMASLLIPALEEAYRVDESQRLPKSVMPLLSGLAIPTTLFISQKKIWLTYAGCMTALGGINALKMWHDKKASEKNITTY